MIWTSRSNNEWVKADHVLAWRISVHLSLRLISSTLNVVAVLLYIIIDASVEGCSPVNEVTGVMFFPFDGVRR